MKLSKLNVSQLNLQLTLFILFYFLILFFKIPSIYFIIPGSNSLIILSFLQLFFEFIYNNF